MPKVKIPLMTKSQLVGYLETAGIRVEGDESGDELREAVGYARDTDSWKLAWAAQELAAA